MAVTIIMQHTHSQVVMVRIVDDDWDTYEEEDYAKAEHLGKVSLKLQELEEHLNIDTDSKQVLRDAIIALDEITNEIYYSY